MSFALSFGSSSTIFRRDGAPPLSPPARHFAQLSHRHALFIFSHAIDTPVAIDYRYIAADFRFHISPLLSPIFHYFFFFTPLVFRQRASTSCFLHFAFFGLGYQAPRRCFLMPLSAATPSAGLHFLLASPLAFSRFSPAVAAILCRIIPLPLPPACYADDAAIFTAATEYRPPTFSCFQLPALPARLP